MLQGRCSKPDSTISSFPDSDPLIRNIKHPTLKAILKYRKVDIEIPILKKKKLNLNENKVSQNPDMPTKVIKKNRIFLVVSIHQF